MKKILFSSFYVLLLSTLGKAQYCTTSLSGGTCDEYISNVNITGTTLNNTSTCSLTANSDAYSAFPASGSSTATLSLGNTYTLNITSFTSAIISVWIDFNRNGLFESTEWTQVSTSTPSATTATSLLIPNTASVGQTGMRIRVRDAGNSNGSTDACSTFGSGETEDYTVTLGSSVPCSGTPTAGTVVVTSAYTCTSKSLTLSLSGTTVAAGLGYQWQSSADGTTWYNATSGTTSFLTTTPAISTYYRCVVSCGSSSNTSATYLFNYPSQICTYCTTSLGGDGCSSYISNVSFGGTTLNHTSTCTASGSDAYASNAPTGDATTSLTVGNTYTFSVTTNTDQIISVWIDYNRNGLFETSEWNQVTTASAGVKASISLFIPATALSGATGMRVRSRSSGNINGSSDACTNFGSGETEDYLITLVPSAPCSGTPTAGTVLVTTPYSCSSKNITFALSGATSATGIGYQWQYSTDGSTWYNAASAINSTYTASPTLSTYYRCVLSCGNSLGTSNAYLFNYTPLLCNYCVASLGGDGCSTYITKVSITGTTLNHASACSQSGTDAYTSNAPSGDATASLIVGSTYTLNVTANSDQIISVWIDYNKNGIFEAAEWTQVTTSSSTTTNISFTIPSSAFSGLTGMRIRSRSTGNSNGSGDACSNFGSGETEDYMVNIVSGSPCSGTPIAGSTVASSTTICAGSNVTLSLAGNSANSGLSYQWQSSANGTSWANASIDTIGTTQVYPSQSTYYRCIVSCNGSSSTSSPIQVLTSSTACNYCTVNLGGGSCAEYITLVSIDGTNFSNSSTCTQTTNGDSYTPYPATGNATTSLNVGSTYTFNVTTSYNLSISLWIDYNKNYVFDADEWTLVSSGSNATIKRIPVTIPITAKNGLTGMRLRTRYTANSNTSTDACSNFGSGETEDYWVNLSFASGTDDHFLNGTAAFHLAPNPSQGTFTILSSVASAKMEILDPLGNARVYSATLNGDHTEVDLSHVTNGVYFVRFYSEENKLIGTKKLVLTK